MSGLTPPVGCADDTRVGEVGICNADIAKLLSELVTLLSLILKLWKVLQMCLHVQHRRFN